MSASYGKSQYSTLRRNQTPLPTSTKISTIDYAVTKPMCKLSLQSVGYERHRVYVKYKDFVTISPLIFKKIFKNVFGIFFIAIA
jgi:hypothetical protein